MMKRWIAGTIAIAAMLCAGHVWAEGPDVRICALTRSFSCLSDSGCTEISLQELDLPRFVKIDFGSRGIVSLDKAVSRPATKFDAIERLDGVIVLHGVDRRGWNMTIGEDSGAMTLTASGDDEGFVVFGNCIKQ